MSAGRLAILLIVMVFLGFTGGLIAEDVMAAADQPVPILTTAQARERPLDYTLPWQYARLVVDVAERYDVPVWIVCRLFSKESSASGNPMDGNWRPEAISPAGAQGISQIMPANLPGFARLYNDGKPIDPHDPETAIRIGIRYLADLYATFHDWRRATGAYNGGLATPPAKWRNETVRYVRSILGGG
jgi:soluble lytic murein transglycosylase-like protein